MKHDRNNTLDILKLFASYMVVFIHVKLYGEMGVATEALARFAVPFFFAISGFYSYKNTPAQLKNKAIHIFRLLISAVIAYTLWDILRHLMKQDPQGLLHYFKQFLDYKNWLKLFVFNIPIHTPHLWYLFAILYVYIIFYFVTLFKIRERWIFAVTFLFLSLRILFGEGLSIFEIVVPFPIVRNYALMGIPFFGLGLLANVYKHKLLRVPNYIIASFVIIGAAETILSRYLLGRNELYIGSLFVLFALVVIFIKFADVKYPTVLTALTGCSTYIYIFHPIISSIITKMYTIIHVDFSASLTLQIIHPFLVCVLSTVLSYTIIKIIRRIKPVCNV